MGDARDCALCKKIFYKRKRDSQKQWELRCFCSLLCSNRAKKPVTPLSERFWNFAKESSDKVCWNWQGGLDTKGYGQLSVGQGESPIKAHRASWQIHFGPIPDGLNVCHACDNPACVNPSHLLLGTQTANAIDMARKARINSKSLENLRPGCEGHHGAGPKSNKEIQNGISK